MSVKQISVFLENKPGELNALTQVLAQHHIDMRAMSLSETNEFGITRILINECKNELRRTARLHPLETLRDRAAPAPDPDSLPLKQAVAALEEGLRSVVVLRYFGGYTLEETAAILKLPRGTVSGRQRRALALLRLELLDSDTGEEV